MVQLELDRMARLFLSVIYLFLVVTLLSTFVIGKTITVSIKMTEPVHQVNERFVSVAFGASMIDSQRYPLRDVLRSKKLIALASALAPAYLRLGGTAADFVTFDPNLTDGDDRCATAKNDEVLTTGCENEGSLEMPDEVVDEVVNVEEGREEEEEEKDEEVDATSSHLPMETELDTYWYKCGCESEPPQLKVFERDRLKLAKRQQLGLSPIDRQRSELEREVDDLESIVDESVEGPITEEELERRGRKVKAKRENRNITLTTSEWDEINEFARVTGLRLLFDVNVLTAMPSGEWNSSNAEELLRYTAQRNYTLDFQLGNEPNHYHHKVHRSISPELLARDFWLLRRLLQTGIGGDGVSDALLVGPDVTRPKNQRDVEYLHEFLKVAINAIDAITWHQYYVNGRTATLDQFTDPATLNVLRPLIQRVLDVREVTGPSKPIWMTETASAYGGGACGLSDRFVDGFVWLDKLGMTARMGVDVVTRQTLWKGQYGLLDGDMGFHPRPDYWLTLLYKRLVGRKVLHVAHDGEIDDEDGNSGRVRLYAHCAAIAPHGAAPSQPSVTLFGMNLLKEEVSLRFEDIGDVTGKITVRKYVLQGNHGHLYSKLVRLNGRTLHIGIDNALPDLKPVVEKFENLKQVDLHLPSFALAFFVLDGLPGEACLD